VGSILALFDSIEMQIDTSKNTLDNRVRPGDATGTGFARVRAVVDERLRSVGEPHLNHDPAVVNLANRSGGEQKMTVQHVHVAEGGQAIVGNVSTPAQGGGMRGKDGEQPHALAYAPGVEMPRQIETERTQVPRAGGSGF
jgi:hypothetical protein